LAWFCPPRFIFNVYLSFSLEIRALGAIKDKYNDAWNLEKTA